MLRKRLGSFVLALSLVAIMAACGKDNHIGPSPSLNLSKTTVQPGESITATVINGSAPYQWTVTGATANCGNEPSCTFMPTASGEAKVNTNGVQLSASFTVLTGTQVTLRFTNGVTGSPVVGASVQVIGGPFVITNGSGEAAVTVYASSFDFDVSLAGYLTFQEKFTGGSEFKLFPVGGAAGYDEQFVKEFIYGDNSRNIRNTGPHSFEKPQANSISVNLDSGLQAVPEAVANASTAVAYLTSDLQNQLQYQVGVGAIPANLTLVPNLRYLGYTTCNLSGNWIVGANIQLNNNGARSLGTMIEELAHAAGTEHHLGPGVMGTGSYHLSIAEINCWLMVLRHRDPGFRFPDCSPRRQCQ